MEIEVPSVSEDEDEAKTPKEFVMKYLKTITFSDKITPIKVIPQKLNEVKLLNRVFDSWEK